MKYIYRISFIVMMLNSHLFGGDLVANAGEYKTLNVTPSNRAVHLDGSASTPSDNIVSYKWYEGEKYIGAGKSRWYGLTQNGEHNITLKIVDETGVKAEDNVIITVVNGDVVNPPKPSELKANAGEDRTLNVTPSNRAIHLDGSKSSSENKIVSYKWYNGDKYIGFGKSRWYGLTQSGDHNITLKIVNETGKTAEDSMILTVVNGNDMTPKSCDKSTAITREVLIKMIENGEDVTQVNTCMITNMSKLFSLERTFNQDISGWDVSNVTNMRGMFLFALSFNQDISGWDVSNVTNMNEMFKNASKFNQSLKEWDISKVTNMSGMFVSASNFNQPIGEWDVSNVTNMNGMFSRAKAFNQPIGDWDVSNVTNMNEMFKNASKFNQSLKEWDVSKVTNMSDMFAFASSFNLHGNNSPSPMGRNNMIK